SKREDYVWCQGAESNRRHCDFQSHALPTELPWHGLIRDQRPAVYHPTARLSTGHHAATQPPSHSAQSLSASSLPPASAGKSDTMQRYCVLHNGESHRIMSALHLSRWVDTHPTTGRWASLDESEGAWQQIRFQVTFRLRSQRPSPSFAATMSACTTGCRRSMKRRTPCLYCKRLPRPSAPSCALLCCCGGSLQLPCDSLPGRSASLICWMKSEAR